MVTPRKLTFKFQGSGGTSSENGGPLVREQFVVSGWSLYRDALTLPFAYPPDFGKQTWQRISKTPSRRFLSQGCLPP